MTAEQRTAGKFELPSGAVVGKYEIIRKIATGGMAELYLARARGTAGFEKLVVLKRILPHVAEDPTFVRMFLDEARLAATLQHPNIADVYDVGESEGAYFFTMEYVHGHDVRSIRIAERNREQRVPLGIALAIVHGTIAALDYAHEKTGPDGQLLGLVHRDVSSSNVLVSYDGAVKLVDFGIARATSSQHKTRTGTLKGKIPYMSPEQARGVPLDRRSDLFSLGVILYELTAGRRPFRGDTDFVILDQIVHHGAKPPSTIVADYPPELEAIVMKLLERDPNQRYATGDDATQALEQFVSKHQLWTSPKVISRYMRTLFADQLASWKVAEQRGITLGEHIAETVTPIGRRSEELVTPPSAFPAVSVRDEPQSEANAFTHEEPTAQRAYIDTNSGKVADPGAITRAEKKATPTEPEPATPIEPRIAAPRLASEPVVSLKPRRARYLVIATVAGVVAVGGYFAFGIMGDDHASATVAAPITPSEPAPRTAKPTPSPAIVEAPPAPKPAAAAVAPAATTTVENHVVVAPRQPISKVVPRTVDVTTSKPPVTKQSKIDRKVNANSDTKSSQWDVNSPFLPGQ